MEIPVYLKIDTYTSNKPNKNLVHFWRYDQHRPTTPVDRFLHRSYADRHVVLVSENPHDEEHLIVTIDDSKNDIENCEMLMDSFLSNFHIDFFDNHVVYDNHVARLGPNNILLPKDLYGVHSHNKNNIAATFFCAVTNHFKIDFDEFIKIQSRTRMKRSVAAQLRQAGDQGATIKELTDGFSADNENQFIAALSYFSRRSQWTWKKKWIFLRSEHGNVVEARCLPSIKSAAKIAQKYLLENFNVHDKLQWHKNEMFVMNDVSIRLIKATV